MSLEDVPKTPMSDLEKGDKVVTIPPEKGFTVIPDELYVFNHNQKSISLYVEVIPPDARMVGGKLVGSKMAFVLHLIPASRSDDLAPPRG